MPRNAVHVLEVARTTSPDVGFNSSGAAWLDRHIEISRPNLPGDMVEEFVHLMGSFYGECVIATFGGLWALADNNEVAVWTEPYGFTYPLHAVRRHLTEPGTPSVAARFEAALSFHSDVAA